MISPGRTGEFAVALLGSPDFDVREIELSSLRLHAAVPLRAELRDINGRTWYVALTKRF